MSDDVSDKETYSAFVDSTELVSDPAAAVVHPSNVALCRPFGSWSRSARTNS